MSETTLANVIKAIAAGTEDAAKPTTLEFGTVVSDEYAPLEIQINDKLILDEAFLELTNAVKDHWVDIEVYMETMDDNDLSEFQLNHYANVAQYNSDSTIHNSNVDKYNGHQHKNPNAGELAADSMKMNPVGQQKTRHTSHLHNIAGRKKIRVYNGLHKGEKVILLRMRGGQKYLVIDRLTDHIVGGEWRTHAGADIITQETKPFEPSGLPGWTEGATSESKWPNAAKPAKFQPGAAGPK